MLPVSRAQRSVGPVRLASLKSTLVRKPSAHVTDALIIGRAVSVGACFENVFYKGCPTTSPYECGGFCYENLPPDCTVMVMCTTSAMCPVNAPVCSAQQQCAPCTQGVSTECMTYHPSTPLCGPNG